MRTEPQGPTRARVHLGFISLQLLIGTPQVRQDRIQQQPTAGIYLVAELASQAQTCLDVDAELRILMIRTVE